MSDADADGHDDGGRDVIYCPECGGNWGDLTMRSGGDGRGRPTRVGDKDTKYRCTVCGTCFDDPERGKTNKSNPGAGSALAARLADMDPDAVPPSDGGGADE